MRAHLRLELKTTSGETLEVRHTYNAVMRFGAQLIADLFAGRGTPITHMGVGTSDAPETDAYETEQLSNEAVGTLGPIQPPTVVAIPPEAFSAVEIDEVRRVARVRVRTTLPAEAAVGTLREAGLISRIEGDGEVEGESESSELLYNRVTFAPLDKGANHELTMFWEVNFPYGDLQGLL